jgi:hypothetical protein
MAEKEMCSRCERDEAAPLHHCPYEVEMSCNASEDELSECDCCDDCYSNCVGDI